jgi:hypothetical protein
MKNYRKKKIRKSKRISKRISKRKLTKSKKTKLSKIKKNIITKSKKNKTLKIIMKGGMEAAPPVQMDVVDTGTERVELPERISTSPQPLQPPQPLRIVTVNLFNGRSSNPWHFFHSKIEGELPDFIFIQEAPPELTRFNNNDSIDDNYELYRKIGSGTEILMTLRNKNSLWRFSYNKIFSSGNECHTNRKSCINTFYHTSSLKFITISNVHLCGGRIDERMVEKETDKLISAKSSMISPIIDRGPDIILGDFNSDMKVFLGKESSNLKFLKELGFSDEDSVLWNTYPYILLDSNGYRYVLVEEPTTNFGGNPDAIWYKDTSSTFVSYQLLNLIKEEAPDHNGILVDFNINKELEIIVDKTLNYKNPIINIPYNEDNPLSGINFNESLWPKVRKSDILDYVKDLEILKVNDILLKNHEEGIIIIKKILSDPTSFPLKLEFNSPLNFPNETFWENNNHYSQASEEKQIVLNQALEITRSMLDMSQVVMYSSKLLWEVVLALISGDESGFHHTNLPQEIPYREILHTVENKYHESSRIHCDKFKKSVSFSLRCDNNPVESVLGVYINDIATATSSGKYNDWFIDNPEFNDKKDLFDRYMRENSKLMNSRLLSIYIFSGEGISEDHIKLTGNFDDTNWVEHLNIPGDNLEEKILFLNKSQNSECRYGGTRALPRLTIQGRLLLDRDIIECNNLFTPEQQLLIDRMRSELF